MGGTMRSLVMRAHVSVGYPEGYPEGYPVGIMGENYVSENIQIQLA